MARNKLILAAAILSGVALATPAAAQNEQFIPMLSYRTGAYAVNGVPYANGVADYYNLKLVELKSRNNSKSVAMPRQIAMYLCKSLTHASLPEIGRSFGGKHHSTVIHSIRKIEDLRKRDPDFNSLMSNFLEGFR